MAANEGKQLKYFQLMEDLKEKILSGDIQAGDKLPSENELSVAYGISRQTVRKALQMLQNMGDLTIIEVSSGTSNSGQEMKLDDAAVETFSSIDGVQAVMPKMNCDYTVNLYAGLNNRYKAEWATLVGMDTSALEAMGYEFLDGITAGGGRDEGVAGP